MSKIKLLSAFQLATQK